MTQDEAREQKETRAFIEFQIGAHADRFDAEGALPSALIGQLASRGWLGAGISKTFGGGGWDALSLGRLHCEVGRACASTRGLLTVQTMVGAAIERWAKPEVKVALLPRLARGEALAAIALSEASAGSDLLGIETQARAVGDGYVLEGEKRWVSFGQIAGVFLIFARLEGAMSAFVVHGATPGLIRKPIHGLLGMRASQLAHLELRNCVVPANHRIGGGDLPLSPVAATALDVGRFSVAWGCVGIGEACLQASLDYASERRQFGKPLLEHQLVARHLANMMTHVRAARLLCEDAAAQRLNGKALWTTSPEALLATLEAKYFASTAAFQIASDAVQVLGASGCVAGSRVERHLRDAKIQEIIEGSNEMQQISIARHGADRLNTSAD